MTLKQEARKPEEVEQLTHSVIGFAIRVHRELGPGFLESVYENALAVELDENRVRYERQKPLAISYKGRQVGEHRLDFLIENSVVMELKAVAAFEKVHFAVVRSYVRASGATTGLLVNFATPTLEVKRVGPEFTGRSRTDDFHE